MPYVYFRLKRFCEQNHSNTFPFISKLVIQRACFRKEKPRVTGGTYFRRVNHGWSEEGVEKLIMPGGSVLFVLIPFIFCISHSHGAETVVVDKAFNGREIKVMAGGSIRVELEELGAAGYAWAIKDLDKDHFEVVSVGTKDAPQPGAVTGAPVVKTWIISTKEKGMAVLKFLHYRPWEGEEKASDTFVLKVRIL